MFKKNKDKDPVIKDSGAQTFSYFSNLASFEGKIYTEDNIRIEGIVNGDIHSKAKVIVGTDGCVKGNIVAESLEISGTVFGDVVIYDLAVLRTSCYYEGQITTPRIEIESGACFFGNCKMDDSMKKDINKSGLSFINKTQQDSEKKDTEQQIESEKK